MALFAQPCQAKTCWLHEGSCIRTIIPLVIRSPVILQGGGDICSPIDVVRGGKSVGEQMSAPPPCKIMEE